MTGEFSIFPSLNWKGIDLYSIVVLPENRIDLKTMKRLPVKKLMIPVITHS